MNKAGSLQIFSDQSSCNMGKGANHASFEPMAEKKKSLRVLCSCKEGMLLIVPLNSDTLFMQGSYVVKLATELPHFPIPSVSNIKPWNIRHEISVFLTRRLWWIQATPLTPHVIN